MDNNHIDNPVNNLDKNPIDDTSVMDNVMDVLENFDVPWVNLESEKGKEIKGSNDKGQDEQVIAKI